MALSKAALSSSFNSSSLVALGVRLRVSGKTSDGYFSELALCPPVLSCANARREPYPTNNARTNETAHKATRLSFFISHLQVNLEVPLIQRRGFRPIFENRGIMHPMFPPSNSRDF